MGYGEFGGGGSLRWQMCYDNAKPGNIVAPPFKQQKASGIDEDGEQGKKLIVVVNKGKIIEAGPDRVTLEVVISQKDDVQLFWAADILKSVASFLNAGESAAPEITAELRAATGTESAAM